MKYKITTNFCWFRGGSMIVKMYFINGMPFTFDDADMYQYYSYLVEEELHPCLFMVDLENPEELPDDISINIDTDEL